MRKLLLFTTFAFAASSVAAQQQAAEPAQNGKPAAATATKKKDETNLERRQRVEGAAGGTAPVPKEERESVGAGAKPHMHFDQLDRGLHRKSDAEVITPAE